PQVVAVRHRRERAVEREDLEAMARQIEVADDLGPEQRHDVGADGKAEAGKHFFGDGGAAEDVAPLEDQHLAPGAREMAGGRQSVVAAADDNRVVAHARNSERRTWNGIRRSLSDRGRCRSVITPSQFQIPNAQLQTLVTVCRARAPWPGSPASGSRTAPGTAHPGTSDG